MEKFTLLTVKEASEMLGTTVENVRRGMLEGTLPIGAVIQKGKIKKYLIWEEKIQTFMYGNKKDSQIREPLKPSN